jgi:hypothetical protein
MTMPPSDKERIEIELALQNKASAVLQKITGDIAGSLKQIANVGELASSTGSSGVAKSIQGVSKLTEQTKETTKVFASFIGVLAPMAGPAGTIAAIGSAFFAAAESLETFAKGRVQLSNLAQDIGMTRDQMSVWERTLRKMGMDVSTANTHVVAMGNSLKNLRTYAESSDMFKALSHLGHGDFAKRLLETVSSGDVDKAFDQFIAKYEELLQYDERVAANFLKTMDSVSESTAKRWTKLKEGVQPAYKVNDDAMREFHARWANYAIRIENMWKIMKQGFISDVARFHEWLKGSREELDRPDVYNPRGRYRYNFNWWDTPPGSVPDKWPDKKETKETEKDSTSTLEKIRDKFRNWFGGEARQFGGLVQPGRGYMVGEDGPESLTLAAGKKKPVGKSGPEIIRPTTPGFVEKRDTFGRGPSDFVNPDLVNPEHLSSGDPATQAKIDKEWKNRILNAIDSGVRLNKYMDWVGRGQQGEPPHAEFGYSEFESVPGISAYEEGTQGRGRQLPDPGAIWEEIERHGMDFEAGRRAPRPPLGKQERLIEEWGKGLPYHKKLSDSIDGALNDESSSMAAPRLGAEITFKNVPSDVTTSAEGEGLDDFKINKSMALDL